jgi:hypothetical protein
VELYIQSPSTPSWRGAQLKAQGQLYLFTFYGVKLARRMLDKIL